MGTSVVGCLAFAEHLPGMGHGLLGQIHAAKHSGYFCYPAGLVQRFDAGESGLAFRFKRPTYFSVTKMAPPYVCKGQITS